MRTVLSSATPWFGALASNNTGSAQFGRLTTQGNYPRLYQITVRFDW
jgi:hypothetical protein